MREVVTWHRTLTVASELGAAASRRASAPRLSGPAASAITACLVPGTDRDADGEADGSDADECDPTTPRGAMAALALALSSAGAPSPLNLILRRPH